MINDIRRSGVNIKGAEKGPGSIAAGIKLLLEYELIIDPESTEIVKELNNYAYSDKKTKLAIDDWNHRIDPLRYAADFLLKKTGHRVASF